jgi:hypothetical protein
VNHQPGCACWGQILSHLLLHPSTPILPRPEFCQDAAAVAFILDRRLESIRKQSDLIDILKKGKAPRRRPNPR